MIKVLFFDTEFYGTKESKFKVVCAATHDNATADEVKHWWVHEDPSEFIAYIEGILAEGYILCTHNLTADIGALISLGLDVTNIKCIDTMAETRQLQNEYHAAEYGNYCDSGKFGKSRYGKKEDKWDKHPVGYGLSAILYNQLGISPNEDKKGMISRILKGAPFSTQDKQEILEYCASDIIHLRPLINKLAKQIAAQMICKSFDEYWESALARGQWMKNCAIVERIGIPMNMERIAKVQGKQGEIGDTWIAELCTIYPFYAWEKNKYVLKDEAFQKFIVEKKLQKVWPKTEASTDSKPRYSKDEDTLKQFADSHPEIRALMKTKSKLTSISRLNPQEVGFVDVMKSKRVSGLMPSIGSDGRSRPYLNPYGSMSSRNQPSNANFVFLMSSWMRMLIQPDSGKVIVGADFRAQETLIAACESGDENMEMCYDSGDFYLKFAKMTGAIPEDATKQSHTVERNIYKVICLAVSYGQGAKGLSARLTTDLKREFTVAQAEKFINQHKQVFSVYWKWQASVVNKYTNGYPVKLKDGWCMFTDNPNLRSVGNVPMQGGGAVVLREACDRCIKDEMCVVATLHDAIYIECSELEAEEQQKKLIQHMKEAFIKYYGREIGVDAKVHRHDDFWIEEKAEDDVWNLRKYLLTPEELQRYHSQQKWDRWPERLTEYLTGEL